MRRQLVGKDRDENEVVDAEDDFEDNKGDEADPDIWICEEFHGQWPLWERVQTQKTPDRISEAKTRRVEKNKKSRGWLCVTQASPVRCRLPSLLSPSSGIGRNDPTHKSILVEADLADFRRIEKLFLLSVAP